MNALVHITAPLLLLGTALVKKTREKSLCSITALVGEIIFAGVELAHYLAPEVRSVALRYSAPSADQNGIVFFFFVHGWWFGLESYCLATFVHFVRRPNPVQ